MRKPGTAEALPLSSKDVRPPARPGFGTVGMRCVVRANHFLLQLAERDLYHDVFVVCPNPSAVLVLLIALTASCLASITPEVKSQKVCRKIMSQLVESHRESYLENRMPASDGRKNLYTAGLFHKQQQFNVTIKFAAQVKARDLQEFLRNRQLDVPHQTIQVLDVVLRAAKAPENYIVIGRSLYSTSLGEGELGAGLEYWRGYYPSIFPTQMGPSLNIDGLVGSFYEPIMVCEFVRKYLN
ncbi:argonaute 5 [Ancistrocladus abbreviatus]